MNYWWVNHKQTHNYEINGGFIWSPKTEKNGSFSQFYTNLTLTLPGDLVFSFAYGEVKAIGVVTGKYSEQPKPFSYKSTGEHWDPFGWLVPVEWVLLENTYSPKAHLGEISHLLPDKYSPINKQGNGNQKCYLAKISTELTDLILSKLNLLNDFLLSQIDVLSIQVNTEAEVEQVINSNLKATEKEQIIRARLGQGIFKKNLSDVEYKCRLTGVADPRYLIASHIKPWRDSNNYERLDGNNGLLLSPHVDWLFDKGWITFLDNGNILTIEQGNDILAAWGLDKSINIGLLSTAQKSYMKYHRENVFKGFSSRDQAKP